MKLHLTKLGIGIAILALNTMALVAQERTTKKAAFDVASIKLNKSGTNAIALSGRGNRFVATNVTLRQLAQFAYCPSDMRPDQVQILGGPGWTDTTRFDIEAVSNEPPANV